jgi:hypothetical protein
MINIIWLRGEKNSRWNDNEDRRNFRWFANLVFNQDAVPYELCQWLLVNREGPSSDALVRLVSDDWRPWDEIWLMWLKYAIAHNEAFALEVGNLPEELEQLRRAEEVTAVSSVEKLIFSDPFLSQLIDEL